jgi:hypothetical protein
VPPSQPEDNRRFWYNWTTYNQQAFADFFASEKKVFHANAPQAKITSKHPVQAMMGDALFCNDIVLQSATQDIYGCDAYNGSLFHYRDAMEAARSMNQQGPVISFETCPQQSVPTASGRHASLQLMAQIQLAQLLDRGKGGDDADLVVAPCGDDHQDAPLIRLPDLHGALFPFDLLEGEVEGFVFYDLFRLRGADPVFGDVVAVSFVPVENQRQLCSFLRSDHFSRMCATYSFPGRVP